MVFIIPDAFLLHAVNCRGSAFGAVSLWCFLFVYEISPEPLNRFVWSLAWTSSKVKVKDQSHQGQKWHFSALSAACVLFTSLASSFFSDIQPTLSKVLMEKLTAVT